MNRKQLEASVRNEYGTDEATQYLQKFINLWVSLPKAQEGDDRDTKRYLSYCLKSMEMEAKNENERLWVEMFEELVSHYNLALREIERSLTIFSVLRKSSNRQLNYPYQWLTVI